MCDPVTAAVAGEALLAEEIAAPLFIDALGIGEAVSGAGALTGALEGAGALSAAGMGGADLAGWGGMTEGVGGMDALSSLAGAGMAGSDIAAQWAALEGTPTLTVGGDAAVGGLGGFASETGFQGAPQFFDDAIGSKWYPENMQQLGDMTGVSRPVQGALGTANKVRGLYNAASGLERMLNPPARPTTVSGLRPQQQSQQQPRQWNQSFGSPLSHAIRGA